MFHLASRRKVESTHHVSLFSYGGAGRVGGVGRGLGVTLGVAVGVGVELGVGVSVGLGVGGGPDSAQYLFPSLK
jgi:hypothetical protein